ncbi:ImmA/IrrE family metallo-endopeptidase [uncultured Draconibacterium sp.]|uniref:ImmA/IrrE family metallo-endopeptidase n=1 Tax=uncultured Draconibacterium sp. TaxID=1573823 RepID=UPI003216E481
MGVRGRRSKKYDDEPTLLNDIADIISKAKQEGLVQGYTVDIKSIIEKNGITIKEDNLLPHVSGYLRREDGKWIIGVNKKHHPNRKRYTMAHEFAHYCLHRDERDSFEDEEIYFRKNHDSSIEFKADEFAATILMPEDMFRGAIEKGIKSIKDLADLFSVSVQAIKHRAKGLGYNTK